MILIYKDGNVEKKDLDIHCPRFRLPVQMPGMVKWVEENEMATISVPQFKYLEFQYVTTVDDEPVYKEGDYGWGTKKR